MYNPFLFDQQTHVDQGSSNQPQLNQSMESQQPHSLDSQHPLDIDQYVPAYQVPVCKGTSKHYFKLENKIALLKEVVAVNPFEDSTRWRIVSDNYNLWTAQHQPQRFYAAVDYLPRKVRDMIANSKQDPNGELPESGSDETDNPELRALLAEASQLMNQSARAEKAKRSAVKRLKIETPKSLPASTHSPERHQQPRSRASIHSGSDTSTMTTPQVHAFATPDAAHFAMDPIGLPALNRVLEPVIARLNHLETKLLVIENINRNNLGLPANVLPFADGQRPGIGQYQELPMLYTALDVETLSRDQLNQYCKTYNVGLDTHSVSEKKRRLACHVGILSPDNYSDR